MQHEQLKKSALRYHESPFHVTYDQAVADRKVRAIDQLIQHEIVKKVK